MTGCQRGVKLWPRFLHESLSWRKEKILLVHLAEDRFSDTGREKLNREKVSLSCSYSFDRAWLWITLELAHQIFVIVLPQSFQLYAYIRIISKYLSFFKYMYNYLHPPKIISKITSLITVTVLLCDQCTTGFFLFWDVNISNISSSHGDLHFSLTNSFHRLKAKTRSSHFMFLT